MSIVDETNPVDRTTPARLAADPGRAQIVDVREPDEVAGGMIAGSRNIPLALLPARLAELDRAVPVVTVCRTGRRSHRAAEALRSAGFVVADLDGGIARWTSEGHPTTPPTSS